MAKAEVRFEVRFKDVAPVLPPVDAVVLTLTAGEARVLHVLTGYTSMAAFRVQAHVSGYHNVAAQAIDELYDVYAALNSTQLFRKG